MPQRAEPAQHRGGDRAHQGAVALGQRTDAAGFELFVERPLAQQNAGENVGGNAAGGEAGGLLRRCGGGGGHCKRSCPAFAGHDNGGFTAGAALVRNT
jgi:hypothetical protein